MAHNPAPSVDHASPGGVYFSLGPHGLAVVLALVAALTVLLPNGLLAGSALILLVLMARLIWRLGELPMLFLALGIQWTQVATPILRSSFEGVSLSELPNGAHQETALWLSLLGLLAVALGMRFAILGLATNLFSQFRLELAAMRMNRIWMAYFVALMLMPVFERFAWSAPRLTQILASLTGVKWALFYVAALMVFTRKTGYSLLILALVFETIQGLMGFFSEYRRAYFVLLLALASAERRLSQQTVITGLTTVALLVLLSCFWTSIKGEYREFLNRGTGQQVVFASLSERIDKMLELSAAADADQLKEAFDSFLDRVGYVEMFARAVRPRSRNTAAFRRSVVGRRAPHVLKPRVFFPDKPGLTPDVLLTERYTGLNIVEQAGNTTEIPLGYLAETYIDFGPIWMFPALFIVGLVMGLMYRYFLTRPRYLVFGYGFALVTISVAFTVESSVVKLTGASLMTFIIMALCHRFLVPHVHRLLVDRSGVRPGP